VDLELVVRARYGDGDRRAGGSLPHRERRTVDSLVDRVVHRARIGRPAHRGAVRTGQRGRGLEGGADAWIAGRRRRRSVRVVQRRAERRRRIVGRVVSPVVAGRPIVGPVVVGSAIVARGPVVAGRPVVVGSAGVARGTIVGAGRPVVAGRPIVGPIVVGGAIVVAGAVGVVVLRVGIVVTTVARWRRILVLLCRVLGVGIVVTTGRGILVLLRHCVGVVVVGCRGILVLRRYARGHYGDPEQHSEQSPTSERRAHSTSPSMALAGPLAPAHVGRCPATGRVASNQYWLVRRSIPDGPRPAARAWTPGPPGGIPSSRLAPLSQTRYDAPRPVARGRGMAA